jgi:hypothetical protein
LAVSFISLLVLPWGPSYAGMYCKLAAMAVVGLCDGLKFAQFPETTR